MPDKANFADEIANLDQKINKALLPEDLREKVRGRFLPKNLGPRSFFGSSGNLCNFRGKMRLHYATLTQRIAQGENPNNFSGLIFSLC